MRGIKRQSRGNQEALKRHSRGREWPLGGARGKDEDVRARDGGKVLAASRKGDTSAALDREVGDQLKVIHQDVEEAQLIGEADEDLRGRG